MDVKIPSPSVFLPQSSVPSTTKSAPPDDSTKLRRIAPTALPSAPYDGTSTTLDQNGGAVRPKSRKSRNGCTTCKKRRLKCDETKPVCMNCERRSLTCEGYKKDYKWRTFEDTIQQSRAGRRRRSQKNDRRITASSQYLIELPTSSHSNDEFSWSPGFPSSSSSTTPAAARSRQTVAKDGSTDGLAQYKSLACDGSPSLGARHDALGHSPSPSTSNKDSTEIQGDEHPLYSTQTSPVDMSLDEPAIAGSSSYTNRSSPRAISANSDHGSDLHFAVSPPNDRDLQTGAGSSHPPSSQTNVIAGQAFSVAPPIPSRRSSISSRSSFSTFLKAPPLDPASPEMLMLRFDRHTCGILSIKDGQSENPWRTIILPLVHESRALFYAVSAMAALHGAATLPQLRLTGMAHMTKSISKLLAEMHEMPLDHVLATALTLAIAEGWDDRRSTGIRHLKGARPFLNKALVQSKSVHSGRSDPEAARLKFFLNTHVYMDVMTRLTSSEEHHDIDLDDLVQTVNEPTESGIYEIDPLMGCATTLFPLLAKVGSLIQKIRRTTTNSLSNISEANELREQLLQWEPPDMETFELPEDESCDPRHALQTAEAFRRATLLYLHQAVTELSSEPSYEQAKGTLAMLAATPLSSRTMVAQTFPLFVASCEMVAPDDREWVSKRWDAMMKRLPILNVLSCWEIVQEVWRRRDQWAQRQSSRTSRISYQSLSFNRSMSHSTRNTMIPVDATGEAIMEDDDVRPEHCDGFRPRSLTPNTLSFSTPRRPMVRLPRRHTDVSLLSGEVEFTVRGNLHWLGVMSDWSWEVII